MKKRAKATAMEAALLNLVSMEPQRKNHQTWALLLEHKRMIVRTLRKGHTVAVISKAISVPIRTLNRFLHEQNISARSLRKQYRRKTPNLAKKARAKATPVIVP